MLDISGTLAVVTQFPELSTVPEHGGTNKEVVVTHWPPFAELIQLVIVHSGTLAVVTQFPGLSTVPEHGGAVVTEVIVTHWPPLYTVVMDILVYLQL